MTRLEELRDKLAAGIDWHEDARTMRQLLTVAQAARNLDVRWRERDPETRISTNFRIAMRRLEDTLAPLLEDSEGSDANCLPTKVNTPQSDASNAAPVATQANPHDYLSTACFHGPHERCRLNCKFCGVDCRCTCRVKAQPAAPGRSQVEASAPGASQWLEGPQNDPGASV
jgi:hypothetical protein